MRKKIPLLDFNKYIFFFLLLLFTGIGNAQEKDTVLYIPKIKYQSKLLITKTDSINKLKKRAVLTAKNSKELSERMAELDSILNSYKKEAQRLTKIIKADSVKVAKNKGRKRINMDSIKAAKKIQEDKDAARLARLNAIVRRNDSINKVKAQQAAARIAKRKQDSTRIANNKIRLKLRNDSIRAAKAQAAAKNRQDSIRIAEKLQKEKFRQDSIRIAQEKIMAERIAKRKQDSIQNAIAQQQKEKLRQDSIRIAQQRIIAEQIAKRRQDSINTAIAQQKAQREADSIRIAQERIIAEQIAQRKQDSINTAIAQQKAQREADSIRIVQERIIAEQIAQRKQDSINTAIAQQKAQREADSIRIAQERIIAEQIAQRKQDSINTAIAQQKAQREADSIRIAQERIIAEQIAQRKQDSINTAIAQQKAQREADSIRIAQERIIAEQIAQRKQDSINTAIAQQKAQREADSIRIAQEKIIAEQLAKRKQDSINTAIAQQKAQREADSIRIAQEKIIAEQIAQRKQDSINTAIAQQKAQREADSIRIAQEKIIAEQLAKRKQDSINTAIAQQKAQREADSIRIAQEKFIAEQIAQRKQDSINTAIAQQKAQREADSIRIAQEKFIAEQIAQRKQDSINTAIAQQKAQREADSIRIAQEKFIAEQIAQRKQDSINRIVAQQKAQRQADSIKTAQAKALAAIIAKRKQDSINTVIAQRKTDSIRIAQEKLVAEQLAAKRRKDSISNAIVQQQREQFRQDSVRVAKLIAEENLKRKQDSIINATAKSKLDKILGKNDSTDVANNDAVNKNRNFTLNDSIVNNDLEKPTQFLDTLPYIRTGNILSKFVKGEMELKQGQIVSNVLKVINIGRKPITFKTDLLIPGSWTRIDDENKIHVAQQNDTIIIPIIISPTKLVNGNTEIIINSFLIGKQQQQLANNYFSLKTKKEVSWDIELMGSQNIYLKNGETNKRFAFQVHNSGNYKQDLFVNYSIPRKNLFLSDTLGKEIKQPNATFTLEANQRKRFDFIANIKDMNRRNYRRVSQDSYDPNKVDDRKSHGLIINSSEAKISKKGLQKRTKLNFIKLPNELKANPYGYPYIPLTVRLSAQNILDDRSFLSLSLRGYKQFDETSNLIYSTDFNYSNSYFTNNIFKNAPWYVGYFDDKKTIEVGQISGNLLGVSSSGKGIKGSYRFNDQHQVGAFYTNTGGFAGSNSSITFGAWHNFNYTEDIELRTQIGRNVNSFSNRSINVISFQPRVRLQKKHNLSFIGSFTNKAQKNEPAFFKANGLMLGTSYTSSFLNKKLRFNFSGRYNDKNFSYGNYDRLYVNQRTSYTLSDKWNVFLSNNYQRSSNYSLFTGKVLYSQETLYNNLVFNTKTKSGNYQPGIFYEYRNYPNSVIHNRGITFRFSNYNFLKNLVNSLYFRAGYTKPTLNNTANKDYFNFELSSLTRYRTWNFNARYNLGAFSTLTSQQTLNDFITPQSIRLSAQNQYLFPSRKVLLESSAVYSYNNVFNNHTLGIYPTVYYYNKTGWRFGMSANYTFTTSDYSSVFDNLDNQAGNQFNGLNQTTNSSFNLNFSLKKDFGIPIPFVDRTAATGNFVAFLDLNGNGIKEKEESTLENVVIKVGKKEILTNLEGEATMRNLLKDQYDFEVFSLENLNGWFPNVESTVTIENDETIYVPFVRGVKVYGDVVLDRQKIAVSDDKPTDLSRIKISATKGDKIYSSLTNKQGRFEFYLPFGDYIVTMDEAVLNGRLQITRNNIPLKLKNTQDGVYISFYIIEKRRKVIFTDFTKKKN